MRKCLRCETAMVEDLSVMVTNGGYIRAMLDKDLSNFLAALAYGRETPWSEPFEKKFCRNCPTVEGTIQETGQTMDFHECEFADGECPHGSDIVWWLQQFVKE